MTDRLVKIIDYSLLPFALTVLSKTLGLYLVLSALNIQWGVGDFSNSLISVTPLVMGKDIQLVSSYSNLLMYITIFIFTAGFLLVENIKQQNSQNPTGSKLRIFLLTNLNFVQKGWQAYTRIFIWTIFLWVATLFIISDLLMGRSYGWVAGVSLLGTISITALLVVIIQKEIHHFQQPQKYQLGMI